MKSLNCLPSKNGQKLFGVPIHVKSSVPSSFLESNTILLSCLSCKDGIPGSVVPH